MASKRGILRAWIGISGKRVIDVTILLTFIFMMAMVGLMAIGVIFGRRPIAGSCGGLKNLGIAGECEICGGDPARCDSSADVDIAVDATDRGRRSR